MKRLPPRLNLAKRCSEPLFGRGQHLRGAGREIALDSPGSFGQTRRTKKMPGPGKQTNPLALVGGIAGAVGGWTLSQYCGASLLVPGVAFFLFLIVFVKTPLRPPFFVGAIAATAAHLMWFFLASAVAGNWSATLLDIVLLTGGIVWLWVRPGVAAALFLGIVQGICLVLNLFQLIGSPFGSTAHRALTVHCLFRLLAVIFLVVGYFQWRRERLVPPPLPGQVPAGMELPRF